MAKIAMDLGNRNIKVVTKKGDKLDFICFQSRFTDEEQLDYSSAEVIEFEGVKYCIGQGEYDFEFNKTLKNYIPLLLCGIARATAEQQVELMISAPAEHVLGLRNKFKEQLEGKAFNFIYNNESRSIIIGRVGVIGEGFATFFAIPRSLRSTVSNLAILDIGGRTVNTVTFINNKQDKVCTTNIGILDTKNDILKTLKSSGKDYDMNIVENLLDTNRIKISDEDKIELIEKIINDMKMYKIDIELYDWFVTGGGSLDIGKEIIEQHFGKECMVDNALFSNVLGNYNFMIAKWGE